MEHLPRWMAGWRRWAEDWFARDSKFLEKLFADAKARVQSGDETPSVAAMLVNDQRDLTDIETVWLPVNLQSVLAPPLQMLSITHHQ